MARRIARKPARGGVDNLVLVQARAEEMPIELTAIATHVTIYFPWAGLLHAILGANDDALAGIARLCAPGAAIEAVISHEPDRDTAITGIPAVTETLLHENVAQHWRAAGLALAESRTIPREEVRAMATSWAKRLGFGAPRTVWRLAGHPTETPNL